MKKRKRSKRRNSYRGFRRTPRRHRRSVRRNAQQHRVSGVATSIISDGGMVTVAYRGTPVVKFDDSKIVLNTGGWKSATTKTRMNQASNQFKLGYEVKQKGGAWTVRYKGEKIPFTGSTLTILKA